MRSGRVSQTALKVGLILVALNERSEWRSRLPDGLGELTERLILAAGVFGYGPRMIRANKKPWVFRISNSYEKKMPGTFTGMGERKIFMNEQVLEAIESGATQVLNVGAGFDTLCLRLAPRFPHVQFFEVDHPATSAAKAMGVEEVDRPGNMTQIAADLKETPLSDVMKRAEAWDNGAKSVVVAEGFFLYLNREAVLEVFSEIAACTGPGTRIAFSHGNELEQHRFANLLLRVLGEPWQSSCATADLPGYMGPGWSVIVTRNAPSRRAIEGFAVAEKS